jgi:hypothetical protein
VDKLGQQIFWQYFMTFNKSTSNYIYKRLSLLIIVLTIFLSLSTRGQQLTFEKKRKHKLVGTITEIIKPDSIQVKGRNYQFFDSTATTTRFAIGGNFFIGSGIFQGNISKYFTSPYYVGIQINFHFNRVIFQLDDYLGLCKVKQTMEFPEQLQWAKNKTAGSAVLGINIGYSIIEKRKINISIFTGLGANLMGAFKNPDNSKNVPSLPYYKVGFHIDFKNLAISDDHIRINDVDVYYSSLRISFGYNIPTHTPRFSEYYAGSMFYISIGMGGIQRGYCSPNQCRF